MLDEKTKLKAQQALELVSDEVGQLEFSELKERSYSFDEINNCDPDLSLKAWLEKSLAGEIKQPIIYTISVENDESAKLAKTCFVRQHENKARGFALSRWNKNIELSRSLYAGSSRNIRQRLKQHLFDSQLRTYALHMGKWGLSGEQKVTLSVQAIRGNPSQNSIEAVEQVIWDRCQPMFGKRSGH